MKLAIKIVLTVMLVTSSACSILYADEPRPVHGKMVAFIDVIINYALLAAIWYYV
mgnify:CR=1 FL=1